MDALAHVDEIYLKGNNQRVFYRYLINNLKQHFPTALITRAESGIKIEKLKDNELAKLNYIPGIANFAAIIRARPDLKEIKKAVEKLDCKNARLFRVTVRRSDKNFPYSSQQLEKELGKTIVEKTGKKVDLENYDLEIRVEVGKKEVLIYAGAQNGIGGLPAKVSGKILCLLSGGIDSPIAAFHLIKRGVETVLVHFQNETKVNDEVGAKIFDLAQVLARYQGGIKLIIVPFAPFQNEIIKKAPADIRMLLSRRAMLKIAQIVATKERCLGLAVGDSIGQVASQTLPNLRAVYQATALPIFTPLIGANKKDITKTAREIGTLAISNRPYEDCCSLFLARHPKTACALKQIELMEKRLVLPKLDYKTVISYNISMDLWDTK